MVRISTVEGTEYDEQYDQTYKVYNEGHTLIPFNMCMRRRWANHYLNVNDRCNLKMGRVKNGKPALCFNSRLLAVIGNVKGKDMKNNQVKVEIDKQLEEAKIHDPFMAENFLRKEFQEKNKVDKADE